VDKLKAIKRAAKRARTNISDVAKRGGLYAGGLASEGYAGGYLQALEDVALLLRGIKPPNTWEFWNDLYYPESRKADEGGER
jgi:hypothetical protein